MAAGLDEVREENDPFLYTTDLVFNMMDVLISEERMEEIVSPVLMTHEEQSSDTDQLGLTIISSVERMEEEEGEGDTSADPDLARKSIFHGNREKNNNFDFSLQLASYIMESGVKFQGEAM